MQSAVQCVYVSVCVCDADEANFLTAYKVYSILGCF